jgi:hypothetical protein
MIPLCRIKINQIFFPQKPLSGQSPQSGFFLQKSLQRFTIAA